MQFEISAQCMFIHTTCCSWSALCAVTFPVTAAACWTHVITFTSDQLTGLLGLFKTYSSSFYSEHAKQLDLGKQTSHFTDSLNLQLEKVLYLALFKSIHVLIVPLSTKPSHRIQKQVAPTWKSPVQSMWYRTQTQRFPITNTLDNTYSLGNTHITISSSALRWTIY